MLPGRSIFLEPVRQTLAPYRILIEVVLVGTLLLLGAWRFHQFIDEQRQIGYDKAAAAYEAKLAETRQAALERETLIRKQLEDANNAATQREQSLKVTAAAAAAAAGSLRDTLNTIRSGVPAASIDALRASTGALAAVLNDCQDRYRGMAETADRHANDVRKYQDAWPKY